MAFCPRELTGETARLVYFRATHLAWDWEVQVVHSPLLQRPRTRDLVQTERSNLRQSCCVPATLRVDTVNSQQYAPKYATMSDLGGGPTCMLERVSGWMITNAAPQCRRVHMQWHEDLTT